VRGAETASHRGAISAKGKTIAVFGTGADVILSERKFPAGGTDSGFGRALISEFPFGTFAATAKFPIRKWIISGRSVGGLALQTAEYSGTRITALLRAGAESRPVRRPRHRDQQKIPGDLTR
jgi:DNA processing protein